MDANQLTGALARAVEAAKLAQEYCFLWIDWWPMCMTKAEWSGWMQAIFSVLAILAAAFLTWWQLDVTRKAADLERMSKDLELSSAALRICARANRMARSTERLLVRGDIDNQWHEMSEVRWNNLVVCLDILLAKDLDGEVLQLVLDSRGFAAIALSAYQGHSANEAKQSALRAMVDVRAIRWNTTQARWRLRKLVRARRAKLDAQRTPSGAVAVS